MLALLDWKTFQSCWYYITISSAGPPASPLVPRDWPLHCIMSAQAKVTVYTASHGRSPFMFHTRLTSNMSLVEHRYGSFSINGELFSYIFVQFQNLCIQRVLDVVSMMESQILWLTTSGLIMVKTMFWFACWETTIFLQIILMTKCPLFWNVPRKFALKLMPLPSKLKSLESNENEVIKKILGVVSSFLL